MSDRESAAHHEAGHAVLAIALDRSVGDVSIAGGQGHTGSTILPGLAATSDVLQEGEIVIRLGGYGAQSRFQNRVTKLVPSLVELVNGAQTRDGSFQGDGVAAYAIAGTIFADKRKGVQSLAQVTEGLLSDPEIGKAVDELAQALLSSSSGIILGSDVASIVLKAGVVPRVWTSRWTHPANFKQRRAVGHSPE